VLTFSKSIIRSKINFKINDPVSFKNAIKNKREMYFKLKDVQPNGMYRSYKNPDPNKPTIKRHLKKRHF